MASKIGQLEKEEEEEYPELGFPQPGCPRA